MLGWSLLVIGAMIRRSCYLTLGPFFTFQLSIRKHHKLITSGLYGFVRHPGYTGAFLVIAGSNLCFFGRGSWLKEYTMYGHKFEILMWIYVVIAVGSGIARIKKEDDMMRKAFGCEWEEWAKEVPWKLFPRIY
jgi:protein-S-isoprenylcysteine O-methyltransferase Ste14